MEHAVLVKKACVELLVLAVRDKDGDIVWIVFGAV